MGHQVNFYVARPDWARIEASLKELGSLTIVHSRSPTSVPRTVPSADLSENGEPWLFFGLVRQSDLPKLLLEHVAAQSYWSIDELRSPVVELTNSYCDGTILRRGRVYYVDGYYDDQDQWVEKSDDFKQWAKTVLKVIRKNLIKRGPEYVGAEALAWAKRTGGQLVT